MSPQNFCFRTISFGFSVKVIRSLALLTFSVAISLFALEQVQAQALFSPTQDPIIGSRIFGAKGCSKCHAVNGVGPKIGPDLGRVQGQRSFYDLASAMWNHLPQMAKQMQKMGISRPELNPYETGDLIAFLYTINYFDRPGDAKIGGQLFVKKHCVSCHQVGGSGGVVGPNLDSLAQLGSPIYFAAAMWDHGPAMAEAMRARRIERPSLSGSEIENLVAYLKSVSSQQGMEPISLLPGQPDQGQELFVKKGCAECHSIKGRGGKLGGDLAERRVRPGLVGFAAAMWNKAPVMMKAMKQKNIPVPQLRPEEMADIVAYLYSVQYFAGTGDPRRGEKLATAEGCLNCHSVAGKGGNVGPDFKKVEGLDQPATIVAAMWTHASTMEQKMHERSLQWPLLKGGEMADIVAFIQAVGRGR